MREDSKCGTNEKENATVKLERDIKKGEIWLIGINGALLITTIVIACIYNGQLNQMRTATEAATKSANAADATLKEIRQGSADTHTLAVAADTQSKQAIEQTKKMGESLAKTDKLIGATSDLAKEAKRSADTAHASVTLARENFARDQRPYLWFKPDSPKFEDGKPVSWNVHIVNSGRTPAINVRNCITIWWAKEPIKEEEVTEERIDAQCSKLTHHSTAPVLPGNDMFVTVLTTDTFSGDSLKTARDRDATLLVTGRVAYRDTFGNEYSSTFCGIHLASGATATCARYNEIK